MLIHNFALYFLISFMMRMLAFDTPHEDAYPEGHMTHAIQNFTLSVLVALGIVRLAKAPASLSRR